MKRLLSLFLIMCLSATILTINPMIVSANTDEYYTYEIEHPFEMREGGVKAIFADKPMRARLISCDKNLFGDVVIPSFFEGYPVTIIDKSAFEDCDKITSVTIPEGVITINPYAFSGCTELKEIKFPSTLQAISLSAFEECTSLESVVIPDNVTWIGEMAFSDCKNLKSVKLSSNCKEIPRYMFWGCENFKEVVIPDGVTTIREGAFGRCQIMNVVIPASVTKIEYDAFKAQPYVGYEDLKYIYYKGTAAEWEKLNIDDDFYISRAKKIYNYPFSDLKNPAPSSWAEAEVNEAKNAGLVINDVALNYQANINRQEFCEMVVKLYEKTTGKEVEIGNIKFDDTYNDEVLKAANLGIVNGYSENVFAPYDYITREQIATMLVRAIGIAYANIDLKDYIYRSFSDGHNISDWAMDSVQFAVDNYIMQGVGDNKIDPLGNTTCEQAILLINRVYQNRKNFENKNIVEIIEELKKLEFGEDEAVNSVTVKYSDGSDASGVRIKEIKKSDLIYQTTGMKGAGVNITSSDIFDKATITFEYNAEQLNGSNPSDLAIAWYNTDLDRIEVLESQVDIYNHTVSVETTHFSKYILVDSKEWYSIWQRGQTIIRETDKNGNYAENFNVQLVVDCSGSMDGDRIATARQCTYDFIQKLSNDDRFSVIKFGSDANTVIPCTDVKNSDMDNVKNIVMNMSDGGGTNFDAALTECINTLDFSNKDYNNIIVFLSDGESSVSDSVLQTLRSNNVRIASVALGSGTNTSMMKKLSDSTNGQYVYAENSSDLDAIYSAIQGSLIGVDATDTDGDGIPDMIEITGMKNQYGKIIRTDPNKYDTDSDGKSDGEEMGKLIESNKLTDMDKKNGITSNVYFEMKSNPLDGIDEDDVIDFVIKDDIKLTMTDTLTLNIGEEGAIAASLVIDGKTAFKNLDFMCEDESIIEILDTQEDGISTTVVYLIAKKQGNTKISVEFNGVKATCEIVVIDSAESYQLVTYDISPEIVKDDINMNISEWHLLLGLSKTMMETAETPEALIDDSKLPPSMAWFNAADFILSWLDNSHEVTNLKVTTGHDNTMTIKYGSSIETNLFGRQIDLSGLLMERMINYSPTIIFTADEQADENIRSWFGLTGDGKYSMVFNFGKIKFGEYGYYLLKEGDNIYQIPLIHPDTTMNVYYEEGGEKKFVFDAAEILRTTKIKLDEESAQKVIEQLANYGYTLN